MITSLPETSFAVQNLILERNSPLSGIKKTVRPVMTATCSGSRGKNGPPIRGQPRKSARHYLKTK